MFAGILPHDGNFYPRSPCGERLVVSSAGTMGKSFLSTLSLRRATAHCTKGVCLAVHFYPRSPCGERHANLRSHCGNDDFYPRSPCGERRSERPETRRSYAISIHALLAESDDIRPPNLSSISISIHALLAESDQHGNAGDMY